MRAQTTHHALNIILAEDTAPLREMYQDALCEQGHNITAFENGADTLAYISSHSADLLLLDLQLGDMTGLDILLKIKEQDLSLPVIVITGYGSVNNAVEAMRLGAKNFLLKPFSIEKLFATITDTASQNFMENGAATLAGMQSTQQPEYHQAKNQNFLKKQEFLNPEHNKFGSFIGTSEIMNALYKKIENAAKSHATVFITGESGTGKEICAEAIHKHSPRHNKAFIPINCAAIPRDLMESELFGHIKGAFTGAIADRDGAARLADGGTLFLDEICEMNPDMQTKLLRFIQNLTFQKIGSGKIEKTDIRIICATNKNPQDEIKAGHFREDLYYRLHVIPLCMPALRERGNDIIDLAHAFLCLYSREESKSFEHFSHEAEMLIEQYSWPGNIRELQNIIRHIVVMHDAALITPDMLPAEIKEQNTHHAPKAQYLENTHHHKAAAKKATFRPLAEIERELIESAIHYYKGNISKAAHALQISPSTIYRKKAEWENAQT